MSCRNRHDLGLRDDICHTSTTRRRTVKLRNSRENLDPVDWHFAIAYPSGRNAANYRHLSLAVQSLVHVRVSAESAYVQFYSLSRYSIGLGIMRGGTGSESSSVLSSNHAHLSAATPPRGCFSDQSLGVGREVTRVWANTDCISRLAAAREGSHAV